MQRVRSCRYTVLRAPSTQVRFDRMFHCPSINYLQRALNLRVNRGTQHTLLHVPTHSSRVQRTGNPQAQECEAEGKIVDTNLTLWEERFP